MVAHKYIPPSSAAHSCTGNVPGQTRYTVGGSSATFRAAASRCRRRKCIRWADRVVAQRDAS
jgi:hypothetical protein